MTTVSKSWRVRLAEFIQPYRLILVPLLCVGLSPAIIPNITATKPTIDCKIPDVCQFGYTTEEIFNWYESIGSDGRLLYLGVVAFDLGILIPLYSSVFFLELYLALPDHLSDTLVSCFPFIMTGLDLIETTTHGYAVLMTSLNLRWMLPPKFWLVVVPMVTKVKFLVAGLSFMAITVFRIFKLFGVWARPKQE